MALNPLLHLVPGSLPFNKPRLLQPLPKAPKLRHGRQRQTQASLEAAGPVVTERRSGNYHPNLWDHRFIQTTISPYSDEHFKFRLEELKREVRQLIEAPQDLPEKLRLIDSVDRLGVAYHFEKEISAALSQILRGDTGDDLFDTALRFRLLRQYGHNVAADVFEKFKDKGGNFKEQYKKDVRGLLSLYEASYLSVDEEDILDKARAFTTRHLKALKGSLDAVIKEDIEYALDFPLRWRMSRIKAMDYIKFYEKEDERNVVLLEFAKLDFNVLQSLHQDELREFSTWWRGMGLNEKLTFGRDRWVEIYVWGMGVSYEARFSKSRLVGAQETTFITFTDDIYDVYGSLEELELYTEAIGRWDFEAIENLPEYMKISYMALVNYVNDFAYHSMKDHGVNVIPILKKAWQDSCNVYLIESRWFNKGETPTLKEYLDYSCVSVGVPVILIHSYISIRQELGMPSIDLWEEASKLIYWSAMIVRLTDDLGTSTTELERGDVPKCIQCYMHESGKSEEAARAHIMNLLIEAWKNLNRECLATTLPKEFVHAACDFARAGHFFYRRGDGFGSSTGEIKDRIESLYFIPT